MWLVATCATRAERPRDGTEAVDSVVRGWTTRLVLVRIGDLRSRLGGVKLDAGDFSRRSCPASLSPPERVPKTTPRRAAR